MVESPPPNQWSFQENHSALAPDGPRSRPLLSCHHGHIPRLIAVAAGDLLRVLPGDWRSNRRQVVSTRNLVDSIYIPFGYD